MITTMATWTLTCSLYAPGALAKITSDNHIPTPQACESMARTCWADYYQNKQREDTKFGAMCKAIANHKEYFFRYTCDKALSCYRT